MGGTLLDPAPVDMPMTVEAKALWIQFYNAHNMAEQATGGGDLAAAWSKLEGYAGRLALIVHHVRLVSDEDADFEAVDPASMAAGIALAQWFAGEAERVYAMLGGDAETDEHAELVDLIQQRGGRITAKELHNAKSKYHPLPALHATPFADWWKPGAGGGLTSQPRSKGGIPCRSLNSVLRYPRNPLSPYPLSPKPPAAIVPVRVTGMGIRGIGW